MNPGIRGYEHTLFVYNSESELAEVAVPFLERSRETGEASVVAAGSSATQVLKEALPDDASVIFDLEYSLPIAAIQTRRRMVSQLTERGAPRVRMVGEVPHPGVGQQDWESWAQYEAVINELYAELPLTGLCIYDRRLTPDHVLADLPKLHPLILDEEGQPQPHDDYVEPRDFLESQASSLDPIEHRAPQVDLPDVRKLRRLRRHIREAARKQAVAGPVVDDFILAVNEVVSEALIREVRPVSLRVWLDPAILVAHVSHPGYGPDPMSGYLLPDRRTNGALRIPIARRFAGRVDISPGPDSFTRLVSYPEAYAAAADGPVRGAPSARLSDRPDL